MKGFSIFILNIHDSKETTEPLSVVGVWLAVLGEHPGQLIFSQLKKLRLRDVATHSKLSALCPSTQRTFHLYGQTRSRVHRKALCQLLSSYTGMTKMLVWVSPVRWYKTRQAFWPTLPFPAWPSDDHLLASLRAASGHHSRRTSAGCSTYTLCGRHSLQPA